MHKFMQKSILRVWCESPNPVWIPIDLHIHIMTIFHSKRGLFLYWGMGALIWRRNGFSTWRTWVYQLWIRQTPDSSNHPILYIYRYHRGFIRCVPVNSAFLASMVNTMAPGEHLSGALRKPESSKRGRLGLMGLPWSQNGDPSCNLWQLLKIVIYTWWSWFILI